MRQIRFEHTPLRVTVQCPHLTDAVHQGPSSSEEGRHHVPALALISVNRLPRVPSLIVLDTHYRAHPLTFRTRLVKKPQIKQINPSLHCLGPGVVKSPPRTMARICASGLPPGSAAVPVSQSQIVLCRSKQRSETSTSTDANLQRKAVKPNYNPSPYEPLSSGL
jgi:hypothetical protein